MVLLFFNYYLSPKFFCTPWKAVWKESTQNEKIPTMQLFSMCFFFFLIISKFYYLKIHNIMEMIN